MNIVDKKMDEPESQELEALIREALNGQPRATELASMRKVLEERITGLAKQHDEVHDDRELRKLDQEIRSLQEQAKALREEEIVARFVEDSVTFAWNASKLGIGR